MTKHRLLDRSKGSEVDYQLAVKHKQPIEVIQALRTKPCEVCGITPKDKGRGKGIHLDHCHTTGKLRGALCPNCNKALAFIKEDIKIAQSLIEYIKKYNHPPTILEVIPKEN
jgi:hypothetical protein